MKRLQNKNIVPAALAGRRLEDGWDAQLGNVGGTFDRRKMEDLWKNPQWSSKLTAENLVQNARLGVFNAEKKENG